MKRRSRKRSSERCAYCGEAIAAEQEHVFPKSWYPDSTPAHLQRLTVPTCTPCNQLWERIENKFAMELLMVVNPDLPGVEGVVGRFIRSFTASDGDSSKDRRARIHRANEIRRTTRWIEPVPGRTQVLVRTPAGVLVRRSPAREIDPALRRRFAEKLIRGLHFWETGEILGDLEVRASMGVNGDLAPELRDSEWSKAWPVLLRLPVDDRLGPGLSYRRHYQEGKWLWAFWIWGQVLLVGMARLVGVEVPPPTSGE